MSSIARFERSAVKITFASNLRILSTNINKMSAQLGNLEETILLLILILKDDDAYGVSIADAYLEKMNKTISIPAVHTVLKRLEDKGLVKSVLGDASPVRGGKRKRIYTVSKLGLSALNESKESRMMLWNMVPATSILK